MLHSVDCTSETVIIRLENSTGSVAAARFTVITSILPTFVEPVKHRG